jgi:hypothetical protein
MLNGDACHQVIGVMYADQCFESRFDILPRLSETVQVSIFFRSTFFRLVENFGVYRDDLIWFFFFFPTLTPSLI